jgi:hypothetical protein
VGVSLGVAGADFVGLLVGEGWRVGVGGSLLRVVVVVQPAASAVTTIAATSRLTLVRPLRCGGAGDV